jgi:hypothetical protein
MAAVVSAFNAMVLEWERRGGHIDSVGKRWVRRRLSTMVREADDGAHGAQRRTSELAAATGGWGEQGGRPQVGQK